MCKFTLYKQKEKDKKKTWLEALSVLGWLGKPGDNNPLERSNTVLCPSGDCFTHIDMVEENRVFTNNH